VSRLNLFVALLLLAVTPGVFAANAKVIKVLPTFLDQQGRQSLAPSLYERDAYQSHLRKYPLERSALRFDVQWKAKGVDWNKTKLRLEIRGVLGNAITSQTLEQPAQKKGWFSNWTQMKVAGDDFQKLGEWVAWRATLWEDDRQIAEQKSFLW
jgi:hypothetical protein